MLKRKIATCQLCGKRRLEIALTYGLCTKCRRVCKQYADDAEITAEGLNRLLDDIKGPPEK